MRGKGKRVWGALLLGAVGLVVAIDPVAAQGADSVTEQLIRDLNERLLAVAVPITLVVEGILVYTVWEFRNADEPEPTKENRRLEITWTVATAVVLLFVGVATYGVMANPNVITTAESVQQVEGDPVVVEVTGVQWFWRFEYPQQNVSTQGEMVVPTDRPLIIKITSSDVIHAFFVPELALKRDAIPGQWNYIRTEVTEPGTYRLFCAEYCGTGHSQMLGNVTAMNETAFQAWLDEQSGGNATGGNATAGNATAGDTSAAAGDATATASAGTATVSATVRASA